jgi:membrane protease YdiL (CAAX protease family)
MTDQPTSGPLVASPTRERIALALWLGIAALQIAVSFAVGGSGSDRDGEPFYDYSLALGSIVLYGILIALTFWIAALYPNRLAALGLRSFPARTLWLVAAVVVASVIVSALLEPILHAGREQGLEPEQWRSDRVAPFVVNAIVVVTLVPFTEELFFRGLGVRVLRFLGPIVAVLGTAIVFSLAHGILVAVPALGFFALLLGWLRVRTDSVWPCVIAHSLYNGVGVIAFYVSSTS